MIRVWGKRLLWAVVALAVLAGLEAFFRAGVMDGEGIVRPRMNDYIYQIVVSAAINVILAVSLQLINGVTGQFSIGHAGFMAVGAYGAGALSFHRGEALAAALGGGPVGEALAFGAALLVGMAVAALAGLLVGIPSLRLQGDYLAIVTLGFGEIIRVVLQGTSPDSLGGNLGLRGIPQRTNLFNAFALALLTIVVIWNVSRSTFGRAMLAVREDEIAAAAMGIRTTRTKVLAFVVSSAFAGLAGGLFAHLYFILSPATFTFVKSIEIVMMIIIGGLGSITGAVVGGVVMTALPEVLRPLENWRMVVYSLVIILVIRFRPQGLFGSKELPDLLFSPKRPRDAA